MKELFLLFLLVSQLNCQSLVNKSRAESLESSYLSGLRKHDFHDVQRNKKLDIWVWYPVESGSEWKIPDGPYPWGRIAENGAVKNPKVQKPLIVLSHGHGGRPEQFNWLVEPLVAAGNVVLATRHADFPPHANHWNRSLDVTFIVNEFLKTPLGKMIDEQRIGFVGYSLGGLTGISLAGAKMSNLDAIVPDEKHVRLKLISEGMSKILPSLDREQMLKDYRDPRIKAAFLMAPSWSWVFRSDDMKTIRIPVRIVAGDRDEVLVSETNGLWYANHISKAQFQWVQGAGHFVFLGMPSCEGRMIVDPDGDALFLYKDSEGVNRYFIQEQVQKLAVDFFDSNL